MNINYYLLTKSFDEKFFIADRSFEEKLASFIDVIREITPKEVIYYSMELFNQPIFNGKMFMEWLYNDGDFHDEKKFLQLKLRHMLDIDENDIETRVKELQENTYNPDIKNALVSFFNYPIKDISPRLIVSTKEGCYDVRRFHLQFVNDSSSLLENYESCFPQIYINERVNQTLKRMKPFRDYIEEVILHLSALNDYAKELFDEYHTQNESVVLKNLEIKGKIYCSIQGNPDYEKKNLSFDFPLDEGGLISITCAPHTKLFTKYSNERIYFHWGHPDVQKGEKVLIGHIGDHL